LTVVPGDKGIATQQVMPRRINAGISKSKIKIFGFILKPGKRK
jgi:hypothetical protein